MNALDEKMPSWFYEFADAVSDLTVEIIGKKYSLTMRQEIGEAVHEAVLTSLHDSPINLDEEEAK